MAVGSRLQTALIYDTRDFEPDPTSGYFEIANEYSGKYIGSQFEFNKLFLQGKGFWKLPFGKRTVGVGWELEIYLAQTPHF
jgi:outer membrane protein assembly factor BamA